MRNDIFIMILYFRKKLFGAKMLSSKIHLKVN